MKAELPGAEITELPLADGGDGTLEVLVAQWGGLLETFPAHDPLMRPIDCQVGFSSDRGKAVIEMARVSGLALLEEEDRDPLRTTTFGLGEVLRQVLETGVRELFLGIGGSATNDGGAGMGQALGFEHSTDSGAPLPLGGGSLANLARIASSVKPVGENTSVAVLCDVENPLLGERGATRVFGPQKGASAPQLEELEAGLAHLAEVWKRDLGRDVAAIPGAGAAGGLGAGALVYLEARLVPGAETLLDQSGIAQKLLGADLAITGEGCLDRTTLDGKLPIKVAEAARAAGIPCWGVGGSVRQQDRSRILEKGFERVFEIGGDNTPLEVRMSRSRECLLETGRRIARAFQEMR
jgi:glycerate kinase